MNYMNAPYAINEKKQAELNALTFQVTTAQYEVDQFQAKVTSLSQKKAELALALTNAQANKETALSNFTQAKQVVDGIREMVRKTLLTVKQSGQADERINDTAKQLSLVINQLIFSVEIIDKLAQMVNKKQASKGIISKDLVAAITAASADANNAVATTLAALNSCYVAMASANESHQITVLEYIQSLELYALITGDTTRDTTRDTTGDTTGDTKIRDLLKKFENATQGGVKQVLDELHNLAATVVNNFAAMSPPNKKSTSLYALLYSANEDAKHNFDTALIASSNFNTELAEAQANLANATVMLNSLKAGLAAATAAALAA